jgi:hypothetical protein
MMLSGKRSRLLAVVAALVLVAGCGETGGQAPAQPVDVALPIPTTAAADAATPDAAPTTEAPTPTPTAAAPVAAAPKIEKKTVRETQRIAYSSRTVKDSTLASGTRKVRTKGVAGQKTLTYEVTYTDGKQTARKLVGTAVTRKPVTEVVAVGTKSTRKCDPNYSGCVPIASDVDCAGGSGNGPAYVDGPVRVTGDDIYGLDNDGDGYGCDS